MVSTQEQQWIDGFLSALGAQPTSNNESWVQQWIAAESPWGTALYGNPLNIEDRSIGYDPAAAASWLQNQGYYKPIVAGLDSGDPANTPGVASALAWWSGHSGNASQLTASYQQLLGPGAYNASGGGNLWTTIARGVGQVASGQPVTPDVQDVQNVAPGNPFGWFAQEWQSFADFMSTRPLWILVIALLLVAIAVALIKSQDDTQQPPARVVPVPV